MLAEISVDAGKLYTSRVRSLVPGCIYAASANTRYLTCRFNFEDKQRIGVVRLGGHGSFQIRPTETNTRSVVVIARLVPERPIANHALQVEATSPFESGGNIEPPTMGCMAVTPVGLCLWVQLSDRGMRLIRLDNGLEIDDPAPEDCWWFRSWRMKIVNVRTGSEIHIASFPRADG